MKTHIYIALLVPFVIGFSSCKKYLDLKPDNSLVVPKSLRDCQLLLDDYARMNASYPSHGEAAADNYYITDADYNANTELDVKNNYIWASAGNHPTQWSEPYGTVFSANMILQLIERLPNTGPEYENIKGTALFFRAFSFYQLAQIFCKPYEPISAETDLGIPLRLSPDLEIKISRANVKETYDRIIKDFKDALPLLPLATSIQSRPTKTAAYAALARTYLSMEDYAKAGSMADEALKLYSTLMDYKSIDGIPRFNPEVIFQAITSPVPNSSLAPFSAKIDKELYESYSPNDLRKTIFFSENIGFADGTYSFNGSYDGFRNSNLFTGMATDELYLVRAECYARSGNVSLAMADLNHLLKNRFDATFVDMEADDADEALSKILIERRKELIFRNQRWTDLRRLNKDSRFAVTLNRKMNNIVYTSLKPKDLRYVMLIPIAQEIALSGIVQNPR